MERDVSYIFVWYIWRFTLFFFPSQSPIACLLPIHSTIVSRIPVLIVSSIFQPLRNTFSLISWNSIPLWEYFSLAIYSSTLYVALGGWVTIENYFLSATFIIPSAWWKFIALRLMFSDYILPTFPHYWHWFSFGSSLPHSLRTLAPNYMLGPSITLAS